MAESFLVSESLGDEIKLLHYPDAGDLLTWTTTLPDIPKPVTIEIEETFIWAWELIQQQVKEDA